MENLSHNINSFELLDSLIIESIQAIRSKHKKRPDELTIFNYIIRKPLNMIIEKSDINNRIAMLLNKGKIRNKTFQGKNSYYIKTIEEVINPTEMEEDSPINNQNIPLNIEQSGLFIENDTENDSPNTSVTIGKLESFIDKSFQNISPLHQDPLRKFNRRTATIKTNSFDNYPEKNDNLTDTAFLKEEIIFLRKEIEHKNRVIFSLLNSFQNKILETKTPMKKNNVENDKKMVSHNISFLS